MDVNMKWGATETVKFLEIFKTYECLWNVGHEGYIKRDLKEHSYKLLSLELENEGFGIIPVDKLKIKIKSLKDAYRVEFNKIKKSTKSGAGTDDIYKPKLAWFHVADTFWKHVVSGRPSSSNLVS
jgi:hypothetical protein